MNSHSPEPEWEALPMMLPDSYLIAAETEPATELRAKMPNVTKSWPFATGGVVG